MANQDNEIQLHQYYSHEQYDTSPLHAREEIFDSDHGYTQPIQYLHNTPIEHKFDDTPGRYMSSQTELQPSKHFSSVFAPPTYERITQKSTNAKKGQRFWDPLWPKETLALLVSWTCQVALVVILLKMSDRPLSRWTGKISFNAMISILTTISKSMLMIPVAACISQLKWLHLSKLRRIYDFELFDKASRGPDGSAELLLRRPLYVVSLGCLITIIASAIGPFTQQVVGYETRPVDSRNSSATFGFAYSYRTDTSNSFGGDSIDPNKVDFTLRGAMMKALYNMDLTPEFNCPGTCSWNGSWTTLGFTFDCEDVTQETMPIKKCWAGNGEYASNATRSPTDMTLSHRCEMTTPRNVTLKTDFSPTEIQTRLYVSSVNHVPGPDYVKSYDPTFMTIAQYKADPWALNGQWQEIGDGPYPENATECRVSLCAWEISEITSSGQNISTSRTIIPFVTQGSHVASDLGGTPNASEVDGSMLRLVWNETGLPEPFSIGDRDLISLAAMMEASFTDVAVIVGDWGFTNWTSASPLFSDNISGGDIHIWLERVTRAVTDAVRTGPQMQLATGFTEDPVIFVRVYWVWFVIPACTEILALLLLVLTVWLSRSSVGIPLWRSSALAPLFHEVRPISDSNTEFVISTDIKNMREMKRTSKKWKMQLQ